MDREPQSLWSVVVLRAGRLLTLAALDGLSTADGRAVLVLAHRAQSPRGVDGVDAKDTAFYLRRVWQGTLRAQHKNTTVGR